MTSSLDDLRVVELDRLILHESHDPRRLDRLRDRIRAEGVQRDPVIAVPLGDDYLVLDGAHRVHAMKEIGSRLILIQVIEPPVSAESWAHVVPYENLSVLHSLEEVESSPLGGDNFAAEIVFSNGEHVYLRAREGGLLGEVRALRSIQSLYPGDDVVRRVDPDQPVGLAKNEAVVRYRVFTAEELVEVVRLGTVLPAGITRFRVRERVLGVRFPLSKLKEGEAATRNVELREHVDRCREQNRIRYYGEPVILFE